jgi:hypothetical protein
MAKVQSFDHVAQMTLHDHKSMLQQITSQELNSVLFVYNSKDLCFSKLTQLFPRRDLKKCTVLFPQRVLKRALQNYCDVALMSQKERLC